MQVYVRFGGRGGIEPWAPTENLGEALKFLFSPEIVWKLNLNAATRIEMIFLIDLAKAR